MKFILLILLAVTASAQVMIPPGALASSKRAATSGGATYLVKQGFEGTGYDNSETWTETGAPDEDSTTSPLADSQSLRILGAVATWTRSPSFTDQSTLWCYFLFRVSGNPGGGRRFFFIRDSSDNDLVVLLQTSTGAITVRAGTTGGNNTVGTLSASTTYHCWVKYVKGTGANAVAEFAFSTDGTKPTSGDNFQTHTSGNATTDADYIACGNTSAQVIPTWDFDKVRADDVEIGNSPE